MPEGNPPLQPRYDPFADYPKWLLLGWRGGRLAADSPREPFLEAFLNGTLAGGAMAMSRIFIFNITSPANPSRSLLKALYKAINTPRGQAHMEWYMMGKYIGLGQFLWTGAVAGTIYWYMNPEDMALRKREHQDLTKAEKKRDIKDLKEAFADGFENFQSGMSYDNLSQTLICIGTLITAPLIIKAEVRKFHAVGSLGLGLGIMGGFIANQLRYGGSRERLIKAREEAWNRSLEFADGVRYSGGDHIDWLQEYRKTRDKQLVTEA
jgi:hypothetical protein